MTNNKQTLDQIIEQMKKAVQDSKEQIFEICEQTRQEYEKLENELKETRHKVSEIIKQTDEKRRQAQLARNRLAAMSRDFNTFSNDEVQKVYEDANEQRVQLVILENDEKQLREKRDQLERRLLHLEDTINRAETLVGQVSVVHNFLDGDLQEVGDMVEDAREKQAFGLKIIQAQEEERRRVAREIHDGPAQLLANVLLRSEIIGRVYDDQGVDAAFAELQDVRSAIKSSLTEVRRIIYDLRPMALDDLGLIPTLRKYLDGVAEQQSEPEIRFALHGNEYRMVANLEVALFRLVQEAVQNALKHAEAEQISVKVEMRSTQITLMIHDDGKGFDTDESSTFGFGLMGMKERVNMLNGELKIEAAKAKGTKISIIVPLDAD
ncbi:sensor histidine kinase [Natribacillus halophilus]|uniref:Signal transduction histidine-protein kinase/phosphatase DegS n=1 Tax=Natribacillus halophilus TaxID=549003 RepID=A0A1G8KPA4_9BACI|nr:sensor histidine kinase [Natribacillus halophilus]SDI45216.1 two-component system, NarL family, sensor histidine kinase DegS [Natribacillus halophilus]